MMAASPAPFAISLQSAGILGDDDAVPEAVSESVPCSELDTQQRQHRLQGVLAELNGLATTSSPRNSPSKGQKPPPRPPSPPSAPQWGFEDELDLEEELAREELAKQREARLRAEQDFDMPPDLIEEDEPISPGQRDVQSPAKSPQTFRSGDLILEDNGLLDSSSAVAGPSRQRSPTVAPLTPALAMPLAGDAIPLTAPVASSSRRPQRITHEAAIPKYIPAGHMSAVTMDGTVLKFERRRRLRDWRPPPPHYGQATTTGLLSRPVHQIIDAVKAREAERIVAADEVAEAMLREAQRPGSSSSRKKDDGRIWIERYRPKRFAELLGDERVHREVMGWLKEWDPCVFKRKTKKHSRGGEPVSDFSSSSFGTQPEYKDPYDRPAQRVLLVSGAPGLGKTTLAHVLARAAGYGVYELNASDARTSGAVTDTIRMALESSSLRDSRPTCLVIDEIDGATGGGSHSDESRGFVKALVDLVENGQGSGTKKGSSKGKKGKRHKPVLRPIICICNDLYAPALRALRPHCRLIRFQKPAQNHLVGRLKTICEAESLSASSRSLSLLAELAQGDIRSCLNALQMAKHMRAHLSSSDGLIEISEADIREAGIGVKDGSTSLQAVWAALFKTASPKERARRTTPHDGIALTQHLVGLAQSSGEYTKLLQGCFEHYPNLHFVDDGWWRIRSVLGWADWGVSMQDRAFASSSFDLMSYVPYSFVKWHSLFANTVNPLPEWPKADYEHYLKRQAFDEIALDLHSALTPNLRAQFCRDSVIREFGPMLMRMLTPDLKPVNQQIVKPAERETLTHLVGVMMELSLNFVRDRTEDGNLVFRLEPPLEVFTSYEGKQSAAVNMGRYAVRQIVMKEIEEERARRRNPGQQGASTAATNALEAYRQHNAKVGGGAQGGKQGKAALDFFGRPIAPKVEKTKGTAAAKGSQTSPAVIETEDESSLPAPLLAARRARAARTLAQSLATGDNGPELISGTSTDDTHAPPPGAKRIKVHYRYNEGYSNAVRQPLKMSSLL
ncbi:unnamed protein product [Parajaminaea phylloscopi]